MSLNQGMMTSNSDEWTTPSALFRALDRRFGFELDPAATEENALCSMFFTKKDNEINKYCWESSANSLCLIRPVIKNNKTIDRSAFNAAKEKLERYTEVHSKFLQ